MDFSIKQISLGELTKVALGASKLTKDHLRVLQTVLMILMKKLDCQNETVRISGFPAQCLKEVLEKYQDSHIQVEFRNVENFAQKYVLLNQLESRAKQIRIKMENHFEEIRRNCAHNTFMPIIWDKYALPTEDLCTLYSPANKDFCIMARNTTFNRAMRERMAQPVVERMNKFELQVETMREKLKAINVQADDVSARLKMVGTVIALIEENRQTISTQWQTVREAMDEIQEMLACKLDRITLPALKKYLEHQFSIADDHLLLLTKKDENCPPVKIIDVSHKNDCLSCSRCENVKPLPILDLRIPNDTKCQCEVTSKEATILQKMDKIRVKSYRVIAVSITSSLNSYDETNASTISQTLRDRGHYVQSYTSYNKYRFKDSMDLRPLITVAEGGNALYRREKSFNPIKSLTFISQGTRNSRAVPNLSISKIKSRLSLIERKVTKSFINGKSNRKGGQKQNAFDGTPVTISSVNFLYSGQ